jgi:hypothetical protein
MGGSDDGGAWGGRIRPDGRCMPLPRAQPTHGKAGSGPGAGGSGDGDARESGSGPTWANPTTVADPTRRPQADPAAPSLPLRMQIRRIWIWISSFGGSRLHHDGQIQRRIKLPRRGSSSPTAAAAHNLDPSPTWFRLRAKQPLH